jgi:periplasmic protein TonB
VGDTLSPEAIARATVSARQFDAHLEVIVSNTASGGWVMRIRTPDAPPMVTTTPRPAPAGAVRIGANVQAANLISAPNPVYPPLAKMARQQGTVRFQATIGTDGTIEDLQVVSGPPLLIPSAMDAVKQWVYKPTLFNGAPVEVSTTIDVNFSLTQ